MTCARCGKSLDHFVEKIVGPHLGIYCPYCGRWIKWQKQTKAPSQLPDDINQNALPDDYPADLNDEPPWEV